MKNLLFIVFILATTASLHGQVSQNISFTHDGKTVFGTFAKPDGPGKFPAIIIVPGSGPNDRNGTLPLVGANVACLYPGLLNDTIVPYKELSDALVDSGYAVLRYDKLEYTYQSNLDTITFHKLWLPAESAIDYIKTREDVDTTKIILIGHSEGSSLIPYMANRRSDIKALISIAGARTPFDSLLAYQIVYIAQTCGGNVLLAQGQANQILAYYHIIRTNTWDENTPPLFGVPAAVWYDYIRITDSVAIHYNLSHTCTLFTGMGLDINVPPAELERFKNEVNTTDDFWSLPGLIHYMTPMDDPHVSKALTDTIVYWLKQQCETTGVTTITDNNISVNIYPNPFTDELTVIPHRDLRDCTISVFDKSGRMVFTRKENNISTDTTLRYRLKHLPAGIYLISLSDKNGHFAQEIVKQ